MLPDFDPPRIDVHPVAWGAFCFIGAGLWIGSFKLMTAACRATAGWWGLGQ